MPQRVKLLPVMIFVVSLVVTLGFHFLSFRIFGILYLVSIVSFVSYFFLSFIRITSPRLYFEKRGYNNAVTEYHYLNNTRYVVIGFVVFFLILLFVPQVDLLFDPQLYKVINPPRGISPLVILEFGVLYPIAICFYAFGKLLVLKNEFDFYLARACVAIIPGSNTNLQKMKYLIFGIRYYDRYLRVNLKRQIRDVEQIYSKVLSDPNLDRDRALHACIRNGARLALLGIARGLPLPVIISGLRIAECPTGCGGIVNCDNIQSISQLQLFTQLFGH